FLLVLAAAPAQSTPASPPATAGPSAPGGPNLLSRGADEAPSRHVVELATAAVPARPSGSRVATQLDRIRSEQSSTLAALRDVVGGAPEVGRRYTRAINGFTVELTATQASEVAALPDVVSVVAD